MISRAVTNYFKIDIVEAMPLIESFYNHIHNIKE